MIQPLRDAHRRSFYLLGAILPLIMIVGIAQREPQTLAAPAVRSADVTVWPSGLVATRIERSGGTASVQLGIRQPLRRPDPLLYFTKNAGSFETQIPKDALVLGAPRDGVSYPLPPMHGQLVLYSLGHQKVIDRLPVEVSP